MRIAPGDIVTATTRQPDLLQRNAHHLLALIGFTLLTVLYTWPLVTQFTTHVSGVERTDNYHVLWLMRYVPDALARGDNPWFAPTINVPYGFPVALGETTPLHTVLLAPIVLVFGEIATYNVVTLASTVLTGWGLFALAYRWLGALSGSSDQWLRFLAAFFAGAIFAFGTYRIMKLQGQLNIANTQFLVMGLYFWDRWLVAARKRDAVLTGIAIGLAALSTWYLGLMLGISLGVYTLAFSGVVHRLRTRTGLVGLGLALLIAGAITAPFLLPYRELPSLPSLPLDKVTLWSASPTDYLIPNPLHPVWGGLVKPIVWPASGRLPSEFAVATGFIVLFLAFIGARRTRGPNWRGLKWIVLISLILSLGPILQLSRLNTGIPLPSLLLRELPVFDGLRTWIRFALMVHLGLAVLSGAGMYIILCPVQRRALRRTAATALIGIALFEAWPGPVGTIAVEPRPVDTWLAAQTDNSPIMEYPLSVAISGPSLYQTLYHGKPITYGYGTYFETLYLQRNPELSEFPADDALDTLETWGVRYVLVTTSAVDEFTSFSMDDVREQPRLRYVTSRGDVDVFELIPEANNAN